MLALLACCRRFDCERAEELCEKLGVTRTPTLKVFYQVGPGPGGRHRQLLLMATAHPWTHCRRLQGADVETYKADYLHIDLFRWGGGGRPCHSAS